MEDHKLGIWENKKDIMREQLTGIGLFCLGLLMALPAILNCG